MHLNELTITEAAAKLAAKECSAVELADACVSAAKEKNPGLNAYLELFEDVKEQAEAADARRAGAERGEAHPLLGIPLAMKDNILIEGRKASAASKMLEPYIASYDSNVARKLKETGAIFLGRTNMDEFALGGSTENSAFGVTRNPHDESRVAGGTSGGSAAAVAAHMALGALGTDTGGSVRNPASFCGVVGLKPTYGAVSRHGLIAAVSSFDQAGPITKTVEDAEMIFNAIRGRDPLDSTSTEQHCYAKKEAKRKIGIFNIRSTEWEGGIGSEARSHFEDVQKRLEHEGYEIMEITLPSLVQALASYYIINFAEVSTNLARFDGVRYGLSSRGRTLFEDYTKTRGEGFGPETRRRIILGTYILSAGYYDAYYAKAVAAREQLKREFKELFERVDAFMTPTMPAPAWRIGEKSDPLSAYLADVFTVPANLTGNPALSIPAGKVNGLPFGVQFTAAHGDEAALFSIGKLLEDDIQ